MPVRLVRANPAPARHGGCDRFAECPRSVDFEDELPRLPTGKLYKRILKDRYWTGRKTGIV